MIRVALCAGHNAKRKGAVNVVHNVNEFDIATSVVSKAAEILRSKYYIVDIIDGTLKEKVNKINLGSYAMVIDYHFNADAEVKDDDDFKGYGCMVMHAPNSESRKKEADRFSYVMANQLGEKDLGGRVGFYWGGTAPGTIGDYFLIHTNCAAFIPEAGFIDNNMFTKKYLLTDEGHDKLAYALSLAIVDFFKDK